MNLCCDLQVKSLVNKELTAGDKPKIAEKALDMKTGEFWPLKGAKTIKIQTIWDNAMDVDSALSFSHGGTLSHCNYENKGSRPNIAGKYPVNYDHDNMTGRRNDSTPETISIDLSPQKLDTSVEYMVLSITCCSGGPLTKIDNLDVRVTQDDNPNAILRFTSKDIKASVGDKTSLVLGTFYRAGSEWEFRRDGGPKSAGPGSAVSQYESTIREHCNEHGPGGVKKPPLVADAKPAPDAFKLTCTGTKGDEPLDSVIFTPRRGVAPVDYAACAGVYTIDSAQAPINSLAVYANEEKTRALSFNGTAWAINAYAELSALRETHSVLAGISKRIDAANLNNADAAGATPKSTPALPELELLTEAEVKDVLGNATAKISKKVPVPIPVQPVLKTNVAIERDWLDEDGQLKPDKKEVCLARSFSIVALSSCRAYPNPCVVR